MCYFIIKPLSSIKVSSTRTNIMLMPYEKFKRLSNSNLINMLTGLEGGISKSYKSKIYSWLKKVSIVTHGRELSFRLILPYRFENSCLRFEPALFYLTSDYNVIFMDLNSNYYSHCETCIVRDDCVYALKLIAKEHNIKITHSSPNKAWAELINKLVNGLNENDIIFKA